MGRRVAEAWVGEGVGKNGAAPGPSMDSELTAQTIERAAIELLERDGVLGGLNLREVADHAGVNRGLVYHYFGSRRELLRSALRRNVRERILAIRIQDHPARFGDRARHVLKGSIRYASAMRLAVLLLLDQDKEVRLMPDQPRTQELLRTDQESGLIDTDVDLVALHATLQSLTLGYVLSRSRLAKEFGVGVRELDERVAALAERLAEAVDGPEAKSEADPGKH
ncbi:helix-turn-helix domain-containing protein [Streptomyces sp. LHD-70]|uniref:TetR/AcrR family transcriptional regulator n=1 Tax=Streptomyces sp. LHD-70 TaxID=3072140 RepID=UPI00280F5F15|nr:helix-turn-helix domain-containing protein [Streptomyces sp. LHD-70]MDQ8703590.1 helix-turn-helix domain-containing protein [Streptomyces sp. LHD-70]